MVLLEKLKEYLDVSLDIANIQDACANGLEVLGKNEINKIAFMVDSSKEGFEKAVEAKADMIIVHHGLIFGNVSYITGLIYNRLKILMDNNISLYGAHLPLDVHKQWGNNARIAKILGLKNITHYDAGHYENILVAGDLPEALNWNSFTDLFKHKISTSLKVIKCNDNLIKRVGVISGSGSDGIEIASSLGVDVFITGESKLSAFHTAKEMNINIVFGGHYNTEVFGLQALQEHLESEFHIESLFIDIPTDL
ncbi:Nif3-like dinuclear metal center hexameric protein [bacterium]|nr:Nif3-like dinuclear metal center hexameric protein [bacterium]